VITAAGLAALSKAEGKHPLAPINATSHWLFGDENIQLDGRHPQQTLIGFATHHASAIFWALVYEYWTPRWVLKGYREATAAPTAIFAALLAMDCSRAEYLPVGSWPFQKDLLARASCFSEPVLRSGAQCLVRVKSDRP
jgi:hypothetical protein